MLVKEEIPKENPQHPIRTHTTVLTIQSTPLGDDYVGLCKLTKIDIIETLFYSNSSMKDKINVISTQLQ